MTATISVRLFSQRELLDAFSIICFACVNAAVGIDRDLVQLMELACVSALGTEMPHFDTVAAPDDPNGIIATIGDQQVLLPLVMREGQRIGGSAAQSGRMDIELLEKFALLGEDLDAV